MFEINTCKRGCCWTPTGVCARRNPATGARLCDCHMSAAALAADEAREKRHDDIMRGDTHRVTGVTNGGRMLASKA